jgi:apolipoprotein N-acyltransferase
VGYAHVDSPLSTLAPWVGVYGLGAVAVYLAAWLALGWRQWGMPQLHRTPVLVCLSLIGLPWLAHSLGWAQGGQPTAPMTVALLQGQIAQEEKFEAGRGVDTALTWYASTAKNSTAQLIVAPETAWPVLPNQLPPEYLSRAIEGLKISGSAWLVGLPLGDSESGYSNSAVALTGKSSASMQPVPYRYDKHHLVPFGEFTPTLFRWFTRLMHIPLGDFERGALGQAAFEHAGQRIAPNICYEDLFGEELALAFVDPTQAPTLMVNLSNIGWFGQSIAIDQHLQISRMRSLEMQRPMLRATNTGATAIIDSGGVVLAQLDPTARGVLNATVQGRSGATSVYSRWAASFGLWPMWALALLFLSIAAYKQKSQI